MGDVNNTRPSWGTQLPTRESIDQLVADNQDSQRRLEVERDALRFERATENGRMEAFMEMAKEAKGVALGAFFAGKDEVALAYRDLYNKLQERVRLSSDAHLASANLDQHITELIQERRRLQYPDDVE